MPLRAALTGLVALASVFALSVSSSSASDAGHTRTREVMNAAVVEQGAPGVVARAQDSVGAWAAASGTADLHTGRHRTPRERFRIGSVTKPFVATVLLQLESEGRLDLDTPVGRLLPDVPLGPYGDGADGVGGSSRAVTVRQLLRHTSGISDYTADPLLHTGYFGKAFLRNRSRSHTPTELVALATAHPPLFPPGAGWSYSNTNYVLAGMVVEKVTGRSYAAEIERRVLRPLKLRDTALPGTSTRIPGPNGRAYSTLSVPGRSADPYDVTTLNPSLAGASGEMISSARDLVRFSRALLTGELLPRRQLAEMRTTVRAGQGDRYGLGLTERRLPCGVTVWGHDGSIHGSVSSVYATVDGRHTAAFHINGDWTGGTQRLTEAEFCG